MRGLVHTLSGGDRELLRSLPRRSHDVDHRSLRRLTRLGLVQLVWNSLKRDWYARASSRGLLAARGGRIFSTCISQRRKP